MAFFEFYFKISSDNLGVPSMAFSILIALLIEFSNSSKTSNIWLSMEFHVDCRRILLGRRPPSILHVNCWSSAVHLKESLRVQISSVCHRFLALINQGLSLNFLPLSPWSKNNIYAHSLESCHVEIFLSLCCLRKELNISLVNENISTMWWT